MIQQMLTIWSLVPLPFLNPAWTSGSSQFTYYWRLAWRILSITLLACEKTKGKTWTFLETGRFIKFLPQMSDLWQILNTVLYSRWKHVEILRFFCQSLIETHVSYGALWRRATFHQLAHFVIWKMQLTFTSAVFVCRFYIVIALWQSVVIFTCECCNYTVRIYSRKLLCLISFTVGYNMMQAFKTIYVFQIILKPLV